MFMRVSKLIILAGITLMISSCEKEELEINETIIESTEIVAEETTKQRPQDNRAKDKTDDGKKIQVCHTNAKMLSINYHAAYLHLEHGDILFSCNPSDGVAFNDIKSELEQKVIDAEANGTKNFDMKDAFEDWYLNDYLTGNWNPEEDNDTGSSGGSGSSGSGTGGIGGGGL